MNKILLTIMIMAMTVHLPIFAQRNLIVSPHIATLQVIPGTDWQSQPVIDLNGDTPIVIGFDDLTHQYRRYAYKIQHCDADWTVSNGLFDSDFCSGFASGNTIDDFAQSEDVNQQYTHYTLRLPNEQCQLKMSGNYKVTVYDEQNEDSVAFVAYFMVLDSQMAVSMTMNTNTDIDINGSHQQIEMQLKYDNIMVTRPLEQIKTVVMQNGRWDNAVVNAKPQYITANGLTWAHDPNLIFEGGNDYHKFELLDVTHTTMGLEEMSWDGSRYNAYVWLDEPQPNYTYNPSANGAYCIRNSDNIDNNTRSEYVMTHFRLRAPHMTQPIYLNGAWTNDRFTSRYLMQWNDAKQEYEAAILLKQGYYSYQYLYEKRDGTMSPVPSQGNFYQTRNNYQVLVYYKGYGDRADKLVAYGTIDSTSR